ncbi:MAG: DUF2283 domain-containing protein [Proteiniphilum sp.]
MNITYDKEVDALYIKFSDSQIVESEEKENNLVLDYDNQNNIVGIEILYFVKTINKLFFLFSKRGKKQFGKVTLQLDSHVI